MAHDSEEDELLGRVQSLVRAFGLLDKLSECDSLSLGEIARSTGLARSTAHRLLTTMEALHYVQYERESNLWSVGLQAFKVGAAFAQTRDLGNLGQNIIRSLMDDVHHCVNVAIPVSEGVCYIHQSSSDGYRRAPVRPGAVLPFHTTASGKIIMAHWSPSELRRYLDRTLLQQRTNRSLIDGDRLRDELALVRKRGYATDDEEYEVGTRCVAALVRNGRNSGHRALSISDAAPLLERDRMRVLGPTLVNAAKRLSETSLLAV